jgi:hypothetical protein
MRLFGVEILGLELYNLWIINTFPLKKSLA